MPYINLAFVDSHSAKRQPSISDAHMEAPTNAGLGVPTTAELNALEERAKELFNSGSCREALSVLEE